jgi:putative NADH-flavin reductase
MTRVAAAVVQAAPVAFDVEAPRALLTALPKAGVRRLVFVGGGGSLLSDSG